jgi:hypothetical protein
MKSIKLDTWEEVSHYVENGFLQVPNWMFEHIVQHGNYYPAHAFSKGQLASKSWLLDELYQLGALPFQPVIAVLGCWIGSLNPFLQQHFAPDRVYGIDQDADSIQKSEKLNQQYVMNNWSYKGVVHDVDLLDCAYMQFETGGELINTKPEWIINTSCEHMSTGWFDSVDPDQLIIMQTNNSTEFDGHINVCYTVQEMQEKYPLSNTLYIGEMTTPAYTRYMQIGYK